jgi:predicted nucleic acid-binding protein
LSGLLLVDKSALERTFDAGAYRETLCVCPVIELELLYSARSAAEYAEIEESLLAYRSLRVDAETMATARGAQRELAAVGSHRIPMPDLLIAACAQQHGAGVVHVDRHYDVLAEVLDFRPVRLGPG